MQDFEIINNNAEIIYKEINNIINTNYMIDNCSSLSSLSSFSNCKYNTISMQHLFNGCKIKKLNYFINIFLLIFF